MNQTACPTAISFLQSLLRTIPDFPKPGINFIDITPVIQNAKGLRAAVAEMAKPFRQSKIDAIMSPESRGFILGAAMALELQCGFIPVRKPGKLPSKTIAESYELEYGTDTLQIHADALKPGQTVLLVDDLLATGGTLQACCRLAERLGANIAGISCMVELTFLPGRKKLADYPLHTLIRFDSE